MVDMDEELRSKLYLLELVSNDIDELIVFKKEKKELIKVVKEILNKVEELEPID